MTTLDNTTMRKQIHQRPTDANRTSETAIIATFRIPDDLHDDVAIRATRQYVAMNEGDQMEFDKTRLVKRMIHRESSLQVVSLRNIIDLTPSLLYPLASVRD
jgi:hypothetical protein